MFSLSALICTLGVGAAAAADAKDAKDTSKLEFDLEGYYRTRGYVFQDLFSSPVDGPGEVGRPGGASSYMQQRLRLQPVVSFEKRAKFTMMVDVLDDVVWGDNASQATTALFAGNPSLTGGTGQETSTFQIKRAWMEFDIPVGKLRIGRQPSDWGLGLLGNDGNGFDDLFGENHSGSTYDRVLFATRPLAIAQKALGQADSGFPLFFAVAVDRLVEDPLRDYYGYKCDLDPGGLGAGDWVGGYNQGVDDEYDPRCDLRNGETKGVGSDGETEQEHGYIEDRDATSRGSDWWADNQDDVYQMIYALIYKGKDIKLFGQTSDLNLGVYTVNRAQQETDSNIWIVDAYGHLMFNGLLLEGEVLNISGQTNAITLPSGQGENTLHKEVDAWGYVVRAGYEQPSYSVIMETGYASGDDNVTDDKFTGRALHSDYNVGLLLYEEVLSRVSAAAWQGDARSLASEGGVYNSRYIYPQLKFRPTENLELIAAYLLAWPDKIDGNVIQCAEGDDEKICSTFDAKDATLGWEIDIGVQHTFHEHIKVALEAAWAKTSDRVPLEAAGLNPEGKFFTLQARAAFEF
jgi:hypothetical protein